MTYQEQKRPLPPTPNSGSSINYSKLLENMPIVLDTNYECMTEREQKLYNEVLNCYKVMEKKDLTINNLKTLAIEYKKKSSDMENAYKLLQQQSQERENFLLKLHEAEMQAIISTQATQTNENLDIILRLEKENDLLRTSFKSDDTLKPVRSQQLPNSAPINNISNISNTSYMCDTADMTYQTTNETISTNKQTTDVLLQGINDMVKVITDKLCVMQTTQEEELLQDTPPLISDASSSDDSFDEMFEKAPRKKKSTRTSSISNFFFKSQKIDPMYERKRNYSLNDTCSIQAKPARRTYSLLSY